MQIKATVVYRFLKFINRLRKKTNPGDKLKLKGNKSNIRGELRHNRNTTLKCNTQKRTIIYAIFLTGQFKKNMMGEPSFVACQTSRFYGNAKYNIKMTTLHDMTTIQINERTYRTEKHE